MRLLAIILVLVSGVSYLRDRLPRRIPVPLEPLVVASDLKAAASLEAAPGSLRGYDVVLVTLDTTRPDRLGCYGNAASPSPNLDRLAREGVIFSSAIATGTTTLPTHASILTGLYSQHHGARANSLYRLGDEQRTLAEILSDAGYASGAFVSSFVLDDRFGLAQGFDVYDAQVGSSPTHGGFAERKAAQTTDAAVRWLRSRGSEPYFLWVHYYDPHTPYDAPGPFRDAYATGYDAEIASVDNEFGRLLQAINATKRQKTWVVVVGDHGEAFGEHGEWSHGYLLQEATLRIPLVMQANPALGRGLHIDTQVSQVDLMPTILSLLGLDTPDGLDGVSLARAPDSARALLAENAEGWAQFGWARISAIYQRSLKYIDGPAPELYDFARDPLDTNDILAGRSADAATLRRLLREREGPAAQRLPRSSVELGASEMMRLEALGYVGADGVAKTDVGTGANPKAMLPVMVEMQKLMSDYQDQPSLTDWTRLSYLVAGKTLIDSRAELIVQFERLAADHPDFAPVYQYLATSYDEEKRPAEAANARKKFDELTGRN